MLCNPWFLRLAPALTRMAQPAGPATIARRPHHARATLDDTLDEYTTKQIQSELDNLSVHWRGSCFTRDDLAEALLAARKAQADAPPPPPPHPAAAATMGEDDAAADEARYADAYERELAAAMALRVPALREELAKLKLGWADLLEKSELAKRLAETRARGALFSKSGAILPGSVGVVTASQLAAELTDVSTPLLLDCFATWCGPCKLIAPQLDELADAAGERLRVAKLDSDAEPQMSSQLNVQGLPTLIFYRKPSSGGSLAEAYRLEGVPGNAGALRQLVREHLGVDTDG